MHVRAPALRRNLGRIRASVGAGVRLVPMVKADAYGLGVAEAVRALKTEDPWGFGVAAVEEGLALRDMGVRRPVIVCSPVPPESILEAVAGDLTLTVSMAGTLGRLREAAAGTGRTAAFHLEVDTGMGRAGFDWRHADIWGPLAHEAHGAGARWAGCYTHFHSADEGPETVHEQWRRFQEALAAAAPPKEGFLVHAHNSAAALRCPEYAGDAARPGIYLYGGHAGADQPAPEPVASVHARVVHTHTATAGDTVGYGSTYAASGDERWATASIGYGDGLPRALGNRGQALVRGHRVPIIGRISMDVTVVDITGAPSVEVGDVVTFLGTDGDERITVDEVAAQVGTISYEVLTGFTPRLRRVWSSDEHGS